MGIPVWTDLPVQRPLMTPSLKRAPALHPSERQNDSTNFHLNASHALSRGVGHMHHTDPADDELEGECLRELEDDLDLAGERSVGQELEPLGRMYVARQYRLDPTITRRNLPRSRMPSSTQPNYNTVEARIESDSALNQTLVDYIHRLRQNRGLDLLDEPDAGLETELDMEFESYRDSTASMATSPAMNSSVDRIRAPGASGDTALNDRSESRAQSYLSSLDLDGFFNSRFRIRSNAACDHTYYSHGTGVNLVGPVSERPSREVSDILQRFEVLDDRIALIRMARRELRFMEYEANASLNGMRFST
ncbi:hypothetical protein V1512DRAFT_2051 [Lipomyces arxii]|uniref:uncharacterized protein n=1 Tax=Lipomyces arxii TaxID=56418 RepID=UPI0034CD4EA6